MATKVRREEGKVWIDYAADIDESCLSGLSHIYRIADVLRYYGDDVDTDWLMGVSGEAFAYYYHPDGTYLTPFVHSWDSTVAALEAYGYSGEWKEAGRGTGVEPSLRTLESEIEAGRLVIAPGIKASRNGINSRCHWWFVVNGVDVEAQEVSLLEKADGAANFVPVPKGDSADSREHPRWYGILRKGKGHYGDNPLLLVRGAVRQPDRRALALGAMERAVRIAREEPVRLSGWGGGEYLAGLAALERLLSDLEAAKGDGVEEFTRLNPVKGDPFRGIHEELLHLRLLSERRRAAAAFLRIAEGVLPAAAGPSANAAAERYDEVARLALEAFVLRHGPVEENDHICEMARLEAYDDNPEWDAYWRRADENLADADTRKELARLIAGALDAERAAVAETERALVAAQEAETEARVKREGGRVWLEGLKSRPAWITHMGCLMGCMKYLGNDASRAWAYGGTGFAFALNIHEAVCPSGPTAWPEAKCDELASNIGVTVARVSAHKSEGDLAATQQQAWRKVQEAIDAGLPCFGWELDIPEWYVIHGYDDEGNILFRDFGGEERSLHHTKLGDTGIGVAAVMVVRPGPAADDRTVVRDALAFAVEHGASRHSHELYHTGLSGYDAWIAALENEELANTDEVIGFGQGYNGMCWAECRRRAFEFLQEAKERLNDDELAPLFDEAVEQYRTVSKNLAQVADTFPFDADQQAAMAERIKDPERRRRAATALKTARDAEAGGLRALAKIALALGAQGIDANALPADGPAHGTAGYHPIEETNVTTGADRVKRERGKVWIEGMEKVNWGGSFFAREDSQARCLVEALRCAGHDVTYAEVMGLSGAAFKLTMAPNLHVAVIHSEMGMDWTEIVSRVWGVEYEWEAIDLSNEKNPGWRRQLHQAAVDSVGRGIPLFYMDGEWNLLVGCREDGSGFVCRPYAGHKADGYVEMEEPKGFLGEAWFASVLRPAGRPADRRESVVRSLQAGVELARRPAEEDGGRLYGFQAYEAWIAALEQDRQDASKHGNAFSYSQLLTSRAAAAEYLRKVAGGFGDEATSHLRAAADRYESISQRLWDGRACVESPWDKSWTAENRAIEARIMRDNLADDQTAIAEIEKALALLE